MLFFRVPRSAGRTKYEETRVPCSHASRSRPSRTSPYRPKLRQLPSFAQTVLKNLRQLPQHREARIFLVVCNHTKVVDRYGHGDAATAGVDNADIRAEAVEGAGF